MPVLVHCASCHGRLQVLEDAVGKSVRCPTCHTGLVATPLPATIPAAPPAAVPAAPPTPPPSPPPSPKPSVNLPPPPASKPSITLPAGGPKSSPRGAPP